MVNFEAACVGDVRLPISVEISSFELTIMKKYDFNDSGSILLWDFAVISQDRGKIPPETLINFVCLFDKAILKRFSHTQNFFIFSKINDTSSTYFSKFLENWTLIRHRIF